MLFYSLQTIPVPTAPQTAQPSLLCCSLTVPICSPHLGMAGHSDCSLKCGREDRGNWGHGGLAFYSPTLSSSTHTPTMASRVSRAGTDQACCRSGYRNACMPSSVWQRCWEQERPYLDALVIVGREQSERCWRYMKIQLFQMMWTPFHSKSTPGYSRSVSAKEVPKF